jgi:DNA-binding transcriptional regulator YhcF (GntR family)
MLDINLRPEQAVYLQIADHIRRQVALSNLHPGERLPAIRALAKKLNLDPGTVARAYRELEQEGVRAITGSCGFMVLFQRELAEAVKIPVFISSLIQVPMVHRMLRQDRKVGILTARKSKLTKDHLRAVGAESVPVCIAGMDDQEEFCETIIFGRKKEMDLDRLEKEVLSVVDNLAKENPNMSALVIECTDLPPFAHLIQQRVHIPIFDIVTLTNMVYEAVVRTSYQGIMPR